MTDPNGSNPFSGFGGFQPAGFLDKMWDMMRLTPFGAMSALPGASQGLPPSLSAMSDLMAPLASVEELDKRITDLRAVEQWLKLNLGMLQSAIQALEVQRATLATLRAFGALAQTSMAAAEAALSPDDSAPREPASAAASASAAKREANAGEPADAQGARDADGETPPPGADAFDPAGWWNLLQSQFNQLARFAMTQPGMAAAGDAPAAGAAAGPKPSAAKKPAPRRAAAPRTGGSAADRAPGASSAGGDAKPAAAKKPARRGA
ncbi:PhaM family polyhydroxyalkanoate granule multifunctional regulatory protein [Burkholderia pseudomallei]|uniref:PhaM family polyhydroxyalkanoate granule multifunctional regulatory protein n=1 Tax=Burkholderia pseudomallei TaxID=28450 RepID=UPI0005E7EAB7|nr:PhaM family polyhydroxyalkanoate granule multifunctional regulatory protein [Burkholderia pseudomallei]MBF3650730.1 transcriptional regulator [Burkholderia pseudomallei]MBF3669503.1 transcriptional regulator [Burkholderia pseudomallei]MBF3698009.1 transcriptional regulator [Burkholderia pseudomallei]MBF3774547.1 transcriptional regulator [Burkholderia pseudomallei]MBY7653177.1 transcriptional regulator [Burkholderia pseudomallei]